VATEIEIEIEPASNQIEPGGAPTGCRIPLALENSACEGGHGVAGLQLAAENGLPRAEQGSRRAHV
jgi:hypothetical protein